jgi:hypothetical protein
LERNNNIYIQPLKTDGFQDSWSLKEKLSGEYENHIVRANAYYQVMDLEVREAGKLTSALLTDDQRFYLSTSAKESLVYHPRLLRAKNWKPIHIFSRQFWLDKEDLLQTKLGGSKNNLTL